MPQLAKGGIGNGALTAPVWKLLKSKQNDEEWNPACRGALRSAIAGRQYPRTQVFAAGWSEHNRCILCLRDIVQADLVKNVGVLVSSTQEATAHKLGVGAAMKVATPPAMETAVAYPAVRSSTVRSSPRRKRTRPGRSSRREPTPLWPQPSRSAELQSAAATTRSGNAKPSR